MSRPEKYDARAREIAAEIERGRLRSLALAEALKASSRARVRGPEHARREDESAPAVPGGGAQ